MDKPVYYSLNSMLAKTTMLVSVVLGATLSTARADTEVASSATGAASADGIYQLTLPKGRVLLDAFAQINLSDGGVFEPFSLSPDVWYGATDELTVGLVHSSLGTTGLIGGVGTSLCLSGTSGGCGSVYQNVGVGVRYGLKPMDKIAWAIDGGLYALDTDPFALAIKLGIAGRWQSGKLVVEAAPNLFLGLTERSDFNKETLYIPVTGLYPVAMADKLAVALQLGFVLPFESLGDNYAVPLSIGAHYDLNESLTLNLAFSLPRLVAGSAPSGFDARSLTLGGTYAF